MFHNNSGRMLCAGCNAVDGGGAVQQGPREQMHVPPQQQLVCGGVAPGSDCFAEFLRVTRTAVGDLAFNYRAGVYDKRAHD